MGTMILFGGLLIATMSIQTPIDGCDTFGFPYTFLSRCSGKTTLSDSDNDWISYSHLMLDFLFSFILVFLFVFLMDRIKKSIR